MRRLALLLLPAFIFFMWAHDLPAKEIKYFYKVYGKKLDKKAHDDRYYALQGTNEVFPEEVYLYFYLPKHQDDYFPVKPMTFYFHIATASLENHYFSVEHIALRDFQKRYDLRLRQAETYSPGEIVKNQRLYTSIDGIIKSLREQSFSRGEYIQKLIDFEADPLPEKLYLEYKFRVRRQDGIDMVVQDVLPLELASYKA